jgi:phage head maturation protease
MATRTLLEVELWEISVVTFPLLAGSTVTAIGSRQPQSGLAQLFRQASRAIGA